MTQDDRLVAVRTGGDHIDRHIDQRLQALQVLARVQLAVPRSR